MVLVLRRERRIRPRERNEDERLVLATLRNPNARDGLVLVILRERRRRRRAIMHGGQTINETVQKGNDLQNLLRVGLKFSSYSGKLRMHFEK